MKRTTDIAFFMCPICGERPYVEIFGINYGVAYCKGKLFKRHPIIRVDSGYCNPSEIFKKLSNGWADSHWKSLNDLPIRMNMEQLVKENKNE